MEEPNLIKLTASSHSATNNYLMYTILAISGYIVVKSYSDIYFKMNPNIQKFTLDITYFLSDAQNAERFLHKYISQIISTLVKSKTAPIKNKIENRNEIMENINEKVVDLESKLEEYNTKKMIDYQQAYLSMNNSITTLTNMLSQINTIQQSNIEAVDKMYATYSDAMQNYLNKLLKVLSIINYHVNITYINPTMQQMISPLTKLYNSIYNSLINNSDFLKKFIPNYNPESIPKLSVKLEAPQDLSVKLKVSSAIAQKNGY